MSVQDTSAEAYYRDVRPQLGPKQKRVLDVIHHAKRPVCNQEISGHMQLPINSVTPRVNELVSKGVVEMAFKGIYPGTGRRVIYWRVKKNDVA
jgi:DNA-binding MarR family transcriptional regulator